MIYLDFETRSFAELKGSKSVGVWNYAHHESTSAILLGWAIDQEDPYVWEPHKGPMPQRLQDELKNPNTQFVAFNSAFERYMLNFKLGFEIPASRFVDPQASARYLSLPGDLDEVSTILGLPDTLAKDRRGEYLIQLFSKPHKKKKKRGEAVEWEFYDWNTHPEAWEEFVAYCKRDVVAEREVLRREKLLGVYPLPPLEHKIWLFDQKVNDRGIPVDRKFVVNALDLASREKAEKIAENNKLTGLENSNSNTQLTAWLLTQGYAGKDPTILEGDPEYPKYSLEKDIVKSELKNNENLTSLARQVLEIRKSASSTSYKKMSAILRQIADDDRLRGQFIYMGSSRCGRWSGNAVQLHNMARPNEIFENVENIDKARSLIYEMEYDKIKELFESVLLTVKYNIRTAFVAKSGYRFNVSDLNAIETRVGAWMAGCEPLLHGFRTIKDFDPYMDFATKMTQIPYDVLMADKKSKDPVRKAAAKKHRQIAKPGVLGCVYRMSAKTLLDYAEKMGVIMTMTQAEEVVKVFRAAYKEIADFWTTIEISIMEVMKATGRITRAIGPNGCIKISKFVFDCGGTSRTILKIQLPSGRYLHYMDARIEKTLMPWKDREGELVYRDALWYATQDQETKQWSETTTHGGKVFENIDQGISRDVLATKLLMLEEAGLSIVGHVHDEGLAETEDTPFDPGIREMTEIMDSPIDWAPGLSLGSAGFEGLYYRKD